VDTQAITVRLPVELYERVRREAFEARASQADIIREALSERYRRMDAAASVPEYAAKLDAH
jgi:hypothetical protein